MKATFGLSLYFAYALAVSGMVWRQGTHVVSQMSSTPTLPDKKSAATGLPSESEKSSSPTGLPRKSWPGGMKVSTIFASGGASNINARGSTCEENSAF